MKTKALLTFIILISLFIRLYKVDVIPSSTYWDETAIGYDAYSIAQTGKDMHGNSWFQAIFPSYGDYKAPVYIWLTSLSTILLGPSALAVRLPSVLSGIGIILLVFLLLKRQFSSPKLALIAAAVMALMPYSIHFSRVGFEAHLAAFFVLLGAFLLDVSKKKPLFLLAATVSGLLGVYSYFGVRVVWPLLFFAFILSFYKVFINKKHLLWIVVSLTLFVLSLMPLFSSPHYQASNQYRLSTNSLLNSNKHIVQSNQYRELAGNSLISRVIYHRWVLWTRMLLENTFAHFSPNYLFFSGDANARHSTGQTGLLYPVFAPFLIIGIVYLLRRKTALGAFLLLYWLSSLIPASVPLEVPHALRSLNSLPVLGMLTAIGIWRAVRIKHIAAQVFLSIALLTFIIQCSFFLHDYLNHYQVRSAPSWQYPQKQLALALKEYEDEYQSIIVNDQDYVTFMYLLFYQKVDPITVRDSFEDFKISQFDNYTLQSIEKETLESTQSKTLVAIKPNDIYIAKDDLSIIEVVEDMSGKPAYYLVDTTLYDNQ